MSQSIQLTGGLSVEGSPEVFRYLSGLEINPEAVLLVSRMNLSEGSERKTIMDFAQLAEEEGFSTRECQVGPFVALEIVRAGEAGQADGPVMATRGLTVLGGDFILVVVMLTLDGGDAGTPLLWEHMVSSLHVEPSGWTLGRIVTYVALALGLLVLLLFTRRMQLARRVPRQIWDKASGSNASTEGWGRTVIASTPGSSPPSPSTATPVAARTLPSSPARTLPARPVPEKPSAAPAQEEPVAPRRGGLTSTLPASGRWSPSV